MHRGTHRRLVSVLALVLAALGLLVTGSPPASAQASPPIVTGLSVHSGSATGDTWVIVHGWHFSHVNAVTFGGVGAARVQLRSPRTLAVLSPTRRSGGTVHIYVYTASGRTAGNAASQFRYVVPVPSIRAMSTQVGSTDGVTGLRVYGHNLFDITRIAVGSQNVYNYTPYSSTRVDVDLFPHTQGVRHLRVYTDWGVSDGTTAASGFTFVPPPMITSLDESAAPTDGGTEVVVRGHYFDRLVGVHFGSAAAHVLAAGPNYVTLRTPAHAEGAVHAIVTTPIGESERTAADRFRYGRTQSAHVSATHEVDPLRGDPEAMSCPSTTFCAVVDRSGVVTYDGSTWHDTLLPVSVGWAGVECSSSRRCIAWSYVGDESVFDGTTWTTPAPLLPDPVRIATCVSDSFCLLIDADGTEYLFNGDSFAATGYSLTPPLALHCATEDDCTAVTDDGGAYHRTTAAGWTRTSGLDSQYLVFASCDDQARCLAVTDRGRTFAFDETWHETAAGTFDPQGLSCASIDYCLSVDQSGLAHLRQNDVWDGGTPMLDGNYPVVRPLIACPTEQACLVVDRQGDLHRFDDGVAAAPETIDRERGELTDISCPTTTTCVAADEHRNALATRDGSAWTTPEPDAGDSVSCPSTTFCVAVGYRWARTFNGSTWGARATVVDADHSLTDVSCPTSSFCLATVDDGRTSTWNGHTWSTPVQPLGLIVRVADCAAAGACTAVTDYGQVLQLSAGTWRRTATFTAALPRAIDCPSTSECLVATDDGTVLTVTPAGVSYSYDVLPGARLLDCATASSCVVANGSQVGFWNGASWSLGVDEPGVTGISCPNAGHCVTTGDTTVADLDW